MSATATYKVRFEPVGLEMEIIEGETVLDAAFRQGIALPHGCKEGQCGSCKAKIHEGDFELLKYSTFALRDYESDDGSVLLCRTHVYGDVTVDLLNFDEELLSRAIVVKDFHGRLTRIDALTHDIRMLEMEVEAPVRFWAGQYVDLMIVGRGIVRAYSMASPPSAGNRLQFIVKKYPNGAFSALLDDGLAVGDAMTAKGPYGTCFRREKRSGAMLLIGGGSGMSPLWSILTDHLESGEQRPVRFFYGARTPCMPTRSMRAWQTATRSKRRSGPKRMAISTICAGRSCLDAGANPVELVEGLELAVTETIAALKRSATSLDGAKGLRAIASIAANDTKLGAMVAEAFERAGNQGIVAVEFGNTVETTLEVVEGMAFERGYLSHHMVTDVERMQAVLDNPYILMTDHKIQAMEELAGLFGLIEKSGRPLLIIAEEVAPPVTMQLLARRERTNVPVAVIHPPEYGHWRKAMLEDIAVTTGGRVISRDLGGRIEKAELADLGSARQVRISSSKTLITAGNGQPKSIAARREQVMRQYDQAPENIERDKFQERIAKLSGGTAIIMAGGATPVEQKRRTQLIEDSINATRAAIEEGIVPGGGVAMLKIAPQLDTLVRSLTGSARQGAELLQRSLSRPLFYIAANCGMDGEAEVAKVARSSNGHGLDARTGASVDMMTAGIVDPVKVSYSAVRNAASVAGLILTTQTLIAKKPDNFDPTAGPALGGGAELL